MNLYLQETVLFNLTGTFHYTKHKPMTIHIAIPESFLTQFEKVVVSLNTQVTTNYVCTVSEMTSVTMLHMYVNQEVSNRHARIPPLQYKFALLTLPKVDAFENQGDLETFFVLPDLFFVVFSLL